jgi:hypothetical protein
MYQVHRTKMASTSDVHAHRTSSGDKEIEYLLGNSSSDIAMKKRVMAAQRKRRKTAVQEGTMRQADNNVRTA